MARWLVLMIVCGTAHAEGRIGFGVRGASTSDGQNDDMIYDDTFRVRGALDATIGRRFDHFVLGVRAGIATPLHFDASTVANSGEQTAWASSWVVPLDVGLDVQVDINPDVWISAWLGTTTSLSHGSSQGGRIEAIDFSGTIPPATWSSASIGLGYGVEGGVKIDGRWSAMLAIESQAIGAILLRHDDGTTGTETDGRTNRSLTIGVSYSLR